METILSIEPHEQGDQRGIRNAGFKVVTTDQEILLLIDDLAACCESWGYFLTEDDTSKFIGAALTNVAITDTNRSTRIFCTSPEPWEDVPNTVYLDDGEVLFVDLETDRGVLQFVAYTAHNGYYGHEARVISKQLGFEKIL